MTVKVTTGASPRHIVACFECLEMRTLQGRDYKGATIMLNCYVVGVHADSLGLSGELGALKQSGQLSPFLLIV